MEDGELTAGELAAILRAVLDLYDEDGTDVPVNKIRAVLEHYGL